MYSIKWPGLFALFSLSIVWFLNSHTLAPAIPESKINSATTTPALLAPTSTQSLLVAKTIAKPKPATLTAASLNAPKNHVASLATPRPATSPPPQSSTTAPISVPPVDSDLSMQISLKVHTLVNTERTDAGLSALSYDPKLATIAKAHSEDMLGRSYFSHTSPDGCGLSCRMKKSGFSYRAIGENIFTMYGYRIDIDDSAAHIVDGWMQSPGHRANILSDDYSTQGIGIAITGNTVMATENLADPR